MLRIGLVMLQGARHAHLHALNEAAKDLQIEVEIFELRNKNDLLQCNPQAIVLPGGESTTMRLVGNSLNSQLLPALFQLMRENSNLPVLGTCAGAILLSDPQDNGEKIVDANISRNAFGNQSESFQSVINSPLLSRDFPGIFIRAPRFLDLGGEASIVASIDDETVGVRTNNRIALTFHPELSGDFAFHKWLINKAAEVSK
ncbi:MAG: pyridoxal 5'-phosphate synthase glutaminase subunit PdxT [Candidatus Poseidoniales archaeon]|jgi:5'-phosphate synthase pdxT subunit|nr:pyridoxal 5'-phosphate synthase glutaminase subunit PdxT [Euryarchaeota archaeon]MDP6292608.1 pyridoxal 5'-phosphate synthase glutaminase subunit PdxT [Candidatus Thalassarchaeaceae archaeon]|tara:strand:- start:500 stop:1102 length:603 start_codon:yes stop_codon:yes gene_type:complete